MRKAYGFPVIHTRSEFGDLIYGEVYTAEGEMLGSWTSTSMEWLAKDLATHAVNYEYTFFREIPDFLKSTIEGEVYGQ
jgi:hypothetical protein